MAVGDYISVDQLRSVLRVSAGNNIPDEALALAISSASAQIDERCGTKFWLDDTASARLYKSTSPQVLFVAHFADPADVTVELDTDDDGVFETTLADTDWQAGPVDRRVGWPHDRIELIGSTYFPGLWPLSWSYAAGPHGSMYDESGYPISRRARVRVTAKWGWPAVPWQVKQACQILAIAQYKSKDLILSQAAGPVQLGAPGSSAAAIAEKLLCDFRDPVVA